MQLESLDDVIEKHDLVCAVTVSSEGVVLDIYGSSQASEISSIYSAILGPYGNAQSFFEGLEGRILPQLTSQGEAFSISSKPRSDLMVVLFGVGKLGTTDLYKFSKVVDADVQSIYESVA